MTTLRPRTSLPAPPASHRATRNDICGRNVNDARGSRLLMRMGETGKGERRPSGAIEIPEPRKSSDGDGGSQAERSTKSAPIKYGEPAGAIRVIAPTEPPVLTPSVARALLRLLVNTKHKIENEGAS
jgi:hypothetical protein